MLLLWRPDKRALGTCGTYGESVYCGLIVLKRLIMDRQNTVPAAEFTKNFGRYKLQAQREAVAVTSHGQIAGYFVGPHEYEELVKLRNFRRSIATVELSEEKIRAIEAVQMDRRHELLNALLNPDA